MDVIPDTKMNYYCTFCMLIITCHSLTELWLSAGKMQWSFILWVQVCMFHQQSDSYFEIRHEHFERRVVLVGKGDLIFFPPHSYGPQKMCGQSCTFLVKVPNSGFHQHQLLQVAALIQALQLQHHSSGWCVNQSHFLGPTALQFQHCQSSRW